MSEGYTEDVGLQAASALDRAVELTGFAPGENVRGCRLTLTWRDLAADLHDGALALEDGSPATSSSTEEQLKAAKSRSARYSPARFRGNYRTTDNVESVSAIILDLDGGSEAPGWRVAQSVDEIAELLRGTTAVVATSPTWTPERPKFRVIVPTDRAMTREEYPRCARALLHELRWIADEGASTDAARYWFVGHLADVKPEIRLLEGALFEVDVLMAAQVPEGGTARAQESRPRESPRPEALTVPISDGVRAWCRKQLETLCARIRTTPYPGPIEPTLNGAAYAAGRWVPHILGRSEVESALLAAAIERNPDPAFRQKYESKIADALTDGAASPWVPQSFKLTDSGNAERFAADHAHGVRFVATEKKGWWIAWDGTRWSSDEGRVHILAKETVRGIAAEAVACEDEAFRPKILAHAQKSESRAGRENMVDLARHETVLRVAPADLDTDPWLLGCTNGVVDLRTGNLLPHDPARLMTKTTGIAYDPGATCPRWEQALSEWTGGDVEMMSYLERIAGYALTGDVSEHALFFLHGLGGNGKSQYTKTLLAILGEYAIEAESELLLDKGKQGQGHTTGVADLRGVRLVSCQEVEEGRWWAESRIKSLTGGDRVRARHMHRDNVEWEPTHKLFVTGNHKPNVRGTDDGIWRRFRVLPFEVRFEGEKKDKALGSKLAAELPGILARAVRGCLEWQRGGLGDPPKVVATTAGYRQEQDVLGGFVEERLDLSTSEAWTSKSAVRLAYETWASSNGLGANMLGRKNFEARLRELGLREARQRVEGAGQPHGWFGVALRRPS